ncbi:MAG: tRNA (adenosine(37)-N6)-threonylcarbamoyltransferase complex dimerization subunit type 1 TsaB [Alphaproteobacteria bacterium]|nr:tRNA (adenosine(37)-N6)-threonylcarbamoyltransferase complex dimerization subunit type 1 TsaB [Alphaproteobacteria bacterium]
MILVINTSGTGIDLVLDDKFTHVDVEKQAIDLPVAVENFLHNNGADWADITAIGVVVGPGSFTGIRIGIAYAKGLSIGLNIPIIPINAFELYLAETPNAFVAIESGRGDFFVATPDMAPRIMDINDVERRQMAYPQTVGHKPFDLKLGIDIVRKKLENGNTESVIPMYLRPSYAEEKQHPETKE